MKMEANGFIRVTYRGTKHRKRKPVLKTKQQITDVSEALFTSAQEDPSNIVNKINKHQTHMLASDFFNNFRDLFKITIKNFEISEKLGHSDKNFLENSPDIVCYGLGSFSTPAITFPQMALLLLIRDLMKCPNVFLYDPRFTELDCKVLNLLNCIVIKENEEGKRKIRKKTIFYLPHCSRPLYNSILWANWTSENLSKIILIGNSLMKFTADVYPSVRPDLQCKYQYIFKILPAVLENDIPNTFQSEAVFSDFTIIKFDSAVLQTFNDDIWQNTEQPFYSCDDEIILRCKEK